ncbi:aminotransferase class V-fold PLP-dependent enzyme [Rhodovulum adriaticum]|uniref:Selenocysteine lyase/cysteine desulfurase n=1 Tax=Rhodovulum adriaticum TaxID=35804 RepID=A0A4R2NNN9_RHOAD|nr:aminotransferase class V-fold PLP-dependent enzyme [Rhodovulum adriaticum]MBK1634429.1 nitrogen fixation protein NifS [Rhodovulum adriaticum]TCP23202.1 selenocysteine lyase/cysteine desulfurase [Rhodovulum adriaticum]
MVAFDADFVRNHFPGFRAPELRDRVFCENAGGSLPCRYTVWRLNRFYNRHKVQPGAPYRAAQAAKAEMDEARNRLSALLGVGRDELHFGPSTTANTYVLAQAFREWLAPGAAIVVTDQDHEANSGPWRRLAAAGIEIREWQVDPGTGQLAPDALERLLDGRVRLVCFPHASNILGVVNDAAAICAMVRGAGALSCVDGVSYAPHGLPDLRRIGADIYLFSSYKTFGPHQGLMVVRRELAHRLPNQGHCFNADDPLKRLVPAGPDHAQIAACAGIADYWDAFYDQHFRAGRDARGRAGKVAEMIRARETLLVSPLLDYLRTRPDLRLLGPDRPGRGRLPTVSIALDEPGVAAAERLAHHGILAGGGDFYAPRLLSAMGVDPGLGVLRLSLLHYTLPGEVDRLIGALDTEL